MKYLYFSLNSKVFISVALSFLFSASITFSQNVGVSDLSTFSPQSLFHIYKNSGSATTLMQLANSTTGSGSGVGLTFDVDGSFNVTINNRASTSIGFNTSGTNRLIILSGGNVGIGCTDPDHKLEIRDGNVEIQYDNADNKLRFHDPGDYWYSMGIDRDDAGKFKINYGGNIGDAAHFAMTTSGNIGIGTASPNNRLQLSSDNTSQGLQFNTSSYMSANQWGTRIYKSDIGGGIPLKFETQSSSTWYGSLDLDHGQDNNHPSLKTYYNTQLAVTSGNVGIGTTSPGYKLDVQGGNLNVGSLYGSYVMYGTLGSFDTRSTNPNPETYNMGVTNEFKANSSNGLNDGGNYNSVLSIRQWSSGGDWSGGGVHQIGVTQNGNIWHRYSQTSGAWGPWYKLYGSNNGGLNTCASANYIVKSNGTDGTCSQIYDNATNVGIGTTSPGKKLEVNGDIKLNSAGYQIYLGENVTTAAKIGINFHTDADPNYWIGKPAGAWTQPLHIGFYTGIKIGANSGYGGTKFYNSSNMGTEIMSVGNGDNHVRIPYYLYIGSYGGISSIPTTYGSLGLLQAKNGYYGILMGQSTSNPNFMWDGAGNGGIYYENWGWLNYTTASNHYTGFGTTSPAYKLEVAGDVYANGGWFRVSGANGLYWESYGPGWYVQDGTWLRTYNNASIWANTGTIATNGSFSGGYGGAGGPSGGAIFSSLIGIGTSSPSTSYAGGVSVDKMNIYSTTTPASSAMVEFTNASGNGVGLESYCSSTTNAYNANEGVTNNADLVYAPSGIWGLAINTSTYSIGTSGLTNALNTGSYGVYASCRYSNSAGYYGLYSYGRVITTGNYYTTSDKKLKKNITPLDSALYKILKLQAVEYDFNDEYSDFVSSPERQAGFIAQDVEEIFPGTSIVSPVILTSFEQPYTQNSINKIKRLQAKAISYQSFIPYMVEAMKEQQKMIDSLDTKLQETIATENKKQKIIEELQIKNAELEERIIKIEGIIKK